MRLGPVTLGMLAIGFGMLAIGFVTLVAAGGNTPENRPVIMTCYAGEREIWTGDAYDVSIARLSIGFRVFSGETLTFYNATCFAIDDGEENAAFIE